MNKPLLAAAAVLLFVLSLLEWRHQGASQPTPPGTHDFGTVRQGDVVDHTFTLNNPLDTPSHIEKVECSAPGMTARFKRALGPLQHSDVRVAWDTRGEVGDVTAHVQIWLSGQTTPVEFLLTGNVTAVVEVKPGRAQYFSLYQHESAERHLTVVNHALAPLVMQARPQPDAHFTVHLSEETPGTRFDLALHVAGDVPPGRYMEWLVLETNNPQLPTVRVAVNILVKTDLYANPETVDFGAVELGQLEQNPGLEQLITQTLMVKRRQGAFSITEMTTDVPFLKLMQEPQGPSAAFRVDVGVVTTRLRRGPIQGTIIIRTDDEKQPLITLPVRGSVG